MALTPNALVKDLMSTGYFFQEFKNYTISKEIDLFVFSREFAVPYLIRTSESYEKAGQPNRSKILNLAVKCLSNANEDDLVDSIFGLKDVAASEISINETALDQMILPNKSAALSYRQKTESAQSLAKFLITIIRMFRLPEVIKKDKAEQVRDSVGLAIRSNWELSVLPSV